MSYFRDLHDLLNDFSDWADLRHEQGADVARIVKRLRKEIKRGGKSLRKMTPAKSVLECEPNDLEAIRNLRPEGPRRLQSRPGIIPGPDQDAQSPRPGIIPGLRDRMKGAWLGRAAGCTLGAPVEGWSIDAMERLARRCKMAFPPEDYWADHPEPDVQRYAASYFRDYLKGHIKAVPVDDDLTYTLLGLLILEQYGADFTTEQVGEAWLKYLPAACTAEHVALANLKAGVPASRAGSKKNPYQEWIGADIRSDPWGYAAPGWPEKAAELAYRDSYLSHRHNGIYGAMFFSAVIAAAFAVDDPLDALKIGLTEIPRECRLARDIAWAFEVFPQFRDWRDARKAVDDHFAGMHPVHTNNNACLTIFGLLLGQKDFTKTIGTTVALGLDNDCTAATAGSILGAIIGARNIPEHWWKVFHNKTRTYINDHEWFVNADIVSRFLAAAESTYGELGEKGKRENGEKEEGFEKQP